MFQLLKDAFSRLKNPGKLEVFELQNLIIRNKVTAKEREEIFEMLLDCESLGEV